MMGVNAFA